MRCFNMAYGGPNPYPIAAGGTGATTALQARSNLGLEIGVNVQAFDATLQSISALGTAADKMIYTTGVDTWAESNITSFGRLIANLSAANSGVLTTNSTGVPSIDTTNFQVLTTGVQMKGNNTNTAPPSGFIGEQIRAALAFGSAINLPNNTQTNIVSISLTAGIWDVSSVAIFNPNATYSGSFIGASISTTSATPGTAGDNAVTGNPPVANVYPVTQVIPSYRLTLSSTTTVYLVCVASVTAGACTGYGRISATRVG